MPWVGPKQFEKLLKSLPADEQENFRNFRHPCQDDNYTGFIVARCCAGALHAELKNYRHLIRVEPGRMSGQFILVVVVGKDCDWTPVPHFRGFKVTKLPEI